MSPATKIARQKLIVEVLQNGPAASQDHLRKALARHGLRVTQATLSRDIHKLGLVKTTVGSAQPVAAALDAEGWTESVGTIAGDDTILIISPDRKSAHKLATRIREMLA